MTGDVGCCCTVIDDHVFGGVDEENGEFVYELGVIGLFGVFTIQLQCAVVGEEGRLITWAQVCYLSDRALNPVIGTYIDQAELQVGIRPDSA